MRFSHKDRAILKQIGNVEVEVQSITISAILGDPPPGYCKVKNFYVDPATGKLIAEFEDIPRP